jgi:two-component system, cell cycle sensor histidine kinase and response regulator CckA
VQQSGGHVWVYSEPERGTTFRIYLPSAAHQAGMTAEVPPAKAVPRREGTTILLVEDDTLMRNLTRQMLEQHGYSVIEAEDGNAALQRFAASPSKIDMVLSDVVMRGMSGPDMVLHLRESHPEMKVVYMSGYTGDLIGNSPGLESSITLLEKPFTRAALLEIIDTVLGTDDVAP